MPKVKTEEEKLKHPEVEGEGEGNDDDNEPLESSPVKPKFRQNKDKDGKIFESCIVQLKFKETTLEFGTLQIISNGTYYLPSLTDFSLSIFNQT